MSLEAYVRDCINNVRQEMRDYVRETVRGWVANLLTSTTIARASEDDDDPLRDDAQGWSSSDGYSTSNAESGETSHPKVRRMEAPCFAYVPVEKEPVKTVGIGANLLGFPVASPRFRPKGIKKGEWAIYNLRAAAQQLVIKGNRDSELTISVGPQLHIKVDQAGKVTIDSKAGQDLVFNGGTLRVARVTDPVNINGTRVTVGTFAFWCEQVRLQILAAGGGNVGDPPTVIGNIDATNGGAARTKA